MVQKSYFITLIKIAFVFLLLILVFPYPKFAHSPNHGIDSSWQIALELIRQKGFTFGSDIIYTYGPLGFLQQRLTIHTNSFLFFFSDLFFFLVIAVLFTLMLPKKMHVFHTCFFFFVFFTAIGIPGDWILFLFFFSGIYFGVSYLHQRVLWKLYFAIFISIFTFYTKANYGLVALSFVMFIQIYALAFKLISVKAFSVSFLFTFISLLVCNVVLKVNFFAYLNSSIEVVSGYNEAQSIFPENRLRIIAAIYVLFGAITITVIYGLILNVRQIYQRLSAKVDQKQARNSLLPSFNELCTLVVIWGVSFILLKYSVVRTDNGHITAFVKLIILPLSLFIYFTKRFHKIGIILISLNIVSYFAVYQPLFNPVPYNICANLQDKAIIIPKYFNELFNPTAIQLRNSFPEKILSKIGTKTVDIIPNEISDLYFNNLNYHPRPSLQSYTTYTAYIDLKNYKMYTGPNAPEYIIYYIQGIDKRYAFGDETITLLSILENYKVVDSWKGHVLLQKKAKISPRIYTSRKVLTTQIGEPVLVDVFNKVPELNEFRMIKVNVKYNLWGKLLNLFFQPPSLRLELITADDAKHNYKTTPNLIGKGLIINSLIRTEQCFINFMQNKDQDNERIKQFRISENFIIRPGIVKSITVHYSTFKMGTK